MIAEWLLPSSVLSYEFTNAETDGGFWRYWKNMEYGETLYLFVRKKTENLFIPNALQI